MAMACAFACSLSSLSLSATVSSSTSSHQGLQLAGARLRVADPLKVVYNEKRNFIVKADAEEAAATADSVSSLKLQSEVLEKKAKKEELRRKRLVRKRHLREEGRWPPKTNQEQEDEDDALAEAALEALFTQLEKDLEDGATSDDDDDNEDFTEEEVMALEDELEAALLGLDYNQRITTAAKSDGDASTVESLTQEDAELLEEDEEEQRVVSLEKWQLKKLAAAAEIGRRHVNVKALAAELGMDRSDVLSWLKNPPPELVMLGASMGLEESEDADQIDEDFEGAVLKNHSKDSKDFGSSTKQPSETQGFAPVTWYGHKRLRKEHIATFERVFRRTRRPTNSMIQNMVELTHIPRKRIVEWFDQKRQEVEPSQSFELMR